MNPFTIASPRGAEKEWALSVPEQVYYEPVPCDERLYVHGYWGYMIFQVTRLAGVEIWDSQYFPVCDITLSGSADMAVYELHTSVKNHFICNWDGVAQPTEKQGQGGFTFTPFVNSTVIFEGGRNYRTTDFHFSPQLLSPYGDAYPKLYEVLDGAESNRPASASPPFELGAGAKMILSQLYAPDLPAGVKERYLQLKSEEYLIAALQQMHAADTRASFTLSAPLKDKAEAIEQILRANLEKPPSLAELVKMVSSNMQYIQLAFKARYGTSIYKYLHELRLEQAKSLLLDTDQTLLDIALQTGLYDAARLSNAFYARYGIRPAAFRKAGK